MPGDPRQGHEIRDEAGLAHGQGGLRRRAQGRLPRLPAGASKLGDYVIVHVGFAISRVDEDEALKTLEILGEMGVMGPS